MTDIDKVVRALVVNLDAPPYPSKKKWPSPVLCVFDCILSLDPRDGNWVNETVKRLQKPKFRYDRLEAVRANAEIYPTQEDFFGVELRDREFAEGIPR